MLAAMLAAAAWWRPGFVRSVFQGGQSPISKSDSVAAPGAGSARKPVAVEAARARLQQISTDIPAIGSLQSDEAVLIAPEIAGRLAEIRFLEGRPVKSGEVLARLDDSLTQADLTQAKAQLTLTSANYDRARVLSRSGNTSDRSLDEAKAAFDSAQAAVSQADARLGKHVLRAPFDGIAGVRNVSVGAYIAVGTPIVNVEKIDRLKVDFNVPELYLTRIGVGQAIDLSVDAIPDRRFRGEIYAINPLVDVNGRSLQIRAQLDNRDQSLRPGMFARIAVKGLKQRQAVLIPESAVVPKGGRSYVFRILDGKAVETPVRLGERRAADVEVLEGLAADTLVVIAGQQQLRDGATVDQLAAGKVRPNESDAGGLRRNGGSG